MSLLSHGHFARLLSVPGILFSFLCMLQTPIHPPSVHLNATSSEESLLGPPTSLLHSQTLTCRELETTDYNVTTLFQLLPLQDWYPGLQFLHHAIWTYFTFQTAFSLGIMGNLGLPFHFINQKSAQWVKESFLLSFWSGQASFSGWQH